MVTRSRPFAVVSALALMVASLNSARGQQAGGVAVELEVSGRVERVFVSDARADNTRIVELALRGVALADGGAAAPRLDLPAPGEVLFVVVDGAAAAGRPQRPPAGAIPRAGDSIRAVVRDAGRGVWAASGADWFETLAAAQPRPRGDAPGGGAAAAGPVVELRGMTCEAKIVQGQIAFQVIKVQPQGPASDAGFQVGDLVIAESGVPLGSIANLKRLAAEPKALELAVVDVNTGRLAAVTLPAAANAGAAPQPGGAADGATDPAAQVSAALGIALEPARAGIRRAVRVTTVDPNGAGAEAGLEPGDVIVALDQLQVASVADFAKALPANGGAITLTVRDVRSGNEVPIEVTAAAIGSAPRLDPPANAPANPPAGAAPADRLGLSTELAFYDAEAAVKVVAVQPGSPAARAGVRPGWIIVKANNAAVMHPDDLAKAAASANGRLTLSVVDPTTERQMAVVITP